MGLDDLPGCREADPRAGGLGGEERIEDPVADVGRYSWARVLDADDEEPLDPIQALRYE